MLCWGLLMSSLVHTMVDRNQLLVETWPWILTFYSWNCCQSEQWSWSSCHFLLDASALYTVVKTVMTSCLHDTHWWNRIDVIVCQFQFFSKSAHVAVFCVNCVLMNLLIVGYCYHAVNVKHIGVIISSVCKKLFTTMLLVPTSHCQV